MAPPVAQTRDLTRPCAVYVRALHVTRRPTTHPATPTVVFASRGRADRAAAVADARQRHRHRGRRRSQHFGFRPRDRSPTPTPPPPPRPPMRHSNNDSDSDDPRHVRRALQHMTFHSQSIAGSPAGHLTMTYPTTDYHATSTSYTTMTDHASSDPTGEDGGIGGDDPSIRTSERKSLSPPANGSLLEYLRDRRSPEIEPKGDGDQSEVGRQSSEVDPSHLNASLRHKQAQRRQQSPLRSLRHRREDALRYDGHVEQSPRSPLNRCDAFENSDALPRDGSRSPSPATSNQRSSDSASTLPSVSSSSTTSSASTATTGVKRSRYLREADRRSIIRRIDNGEKQAALAKEFGVTRAAICHINKNRVEILTRSARADVHSSARHPKRGMYTTSRSSSFFGAFSADTEALDGAPPPMVHEVRSQALALHLTTLRRKDTPPRTYRAVADRAFRVLLEEALASVPTRSVEILTAADVVCPGVVVDRATCAIVMNDSGFPMLEAFRSIQPDSPTGFITLDGGVVRRVCAPTSLRAHHVFLLEAVCTSGREAVAAIQALVDLGADEGEIYFVALVAGAGAVGTIARSFAGVRVVVAAIDANGDGDGGDGGLRPGVGHFDERYFNTTVVRHSALGANVDL